MISSLKRPPTNHPLLKYDESTRAYYLKSFRLIDQPYSEGYDIWLRYGREDHLTTWSQFIAGKLPDWLSIGRCLKSVSRPGSARKS